MIRSHREEVKWSMTAHISKTRRQRFVRMNVDGEVFLIHPSEAMAMADQLVDAAEQASRI